MAKIILENTREHDIILSHASGNLIVPASRQNPDDESKSVAGVAEADDAVIADLQKNSAVVEHYFSEGWLRTPKQSSAKQSSSAKQ